MVCILRAVLERAVIVLCLAAALPGCTAQDTRPPSPTSGEVVPALGKHTLIGYQARDNSRWFGSGDEGVYRYDGKTIVHFTTEHGLGGDHVRDFQEDRAGNLYVCSDPGGISRFDGRAFTRLRAVDPSKSKWKLQPDDVWFPAETESGAVYRFDGTSLHRLSLPKIKAVEDHLAQHPHTPAMKYSPYDVYTVFKDSKGCLWFGTATLGVCRYDGKSFAWADKTEIGFGPDDAFGVRSIIEDKDGRFWFSNTMNRYAVPPAAEQAAGQLRLRKEPGVGTGKEGHSVFMSAIKDRNGHLWLATLGAGVWRYDGKAMTNYPVPATGQPIWIFQIYHDRQGVPWLGTQENGVFRFNGTSFEKFKP